MSATYQVKKGDSVWTIANQHNMTIPQLRQLNPQIPKNNLIKEDDILTVVEIKPPQKEQAAQSSQANKTDSARENFSRKSQDNRQACPTQQKIALFPVRYAIDESPEQRNYSQKHPIPKDWGATGQPEIKTRDYCLRQLRDGWVYVWDGKKFDEYYLIGKNFTHTKRQDKEIPQEPLVLQYPESGEKGTKSYLEYDTSKIIHIAYAQERWTEYLYEVLQKNEDNQRNTWMRMVELPMLCVKTQPHTHLIKDIANYVADIYQDILNPSDSFKTTIVPYQAADTETDSKAPQLSATIVGAVPEKETAYFVALDDQLGIINDLTLQLTGRNSAFLNFSKVHQHKLYTAQVVKAMAGTTLDEKDYPSGTTTLAEKQHFERELEKCLYEAQGINDSLKLAGDSSYIFASDEAAKDVWNQHTTAGMMTRIDPTITAAFKKKYAQETKYNEQWFVEKFNIWDNHAKSRRQVKYNEATGYLVHEIEQQNIQQHINENAKDLIKYLDYTGNDPFRIFFDPADKAQCAKLTVNFGTVQEALLFSPSETTQQWYADSLVKKQNLLSLISYNFSLTHANAFEKTIAYYLEHNELEQGQSTFDPGPLISKMIGVANATYASPDVFGSLGELYKRFTQPIPTASLPSAEIFSTAALTPKELFMQRIQTAFTRDRYVQSPFFKALDHQTQQTFFTREEVIGNLELPNKAWQKNVFTITSYATKAIRTESQVIHMSLQIMHSITVEGTNTEFTPIHYTDTQYEKTLSAYKQRIGNIRAAIKRIEPQSQGFNKQVANQKGRAGKSIRIRAWRLSQELAALKAELAELLANIPQKVKLTGYLISEVPNITKQEVIIKIRFAFMQCLDLTDATLKKWLGFDGAKLYHDIRQQQSLLPVQERLPVPAKPIQGQTAAQIEENIISKSGFSIFKCLMIGLNLANCVNSLNTMLSKDSIELNDALSVVTAHAYFGSLLFSFKADWSKVKDLTIDLGKQSLTTEKLLNVAPKAWPKNLPVADKALALEFRLMAKGMAGFNFIASGVETIQIAMNLSNATTAGEQVSQTVKMFSTAAMAIISGVQLFALLGASSWMAFAFGPWTVIAGFIALFVYAIATFWENYFHIEGFDLWLNRSIWGTDYSWSNDEEGHKLELRALQELLQQPTVLALPIKDNSNNLVGRRLQIVLPPTLQRQYINMSLLIRDNVRIRPSPWRGGGAKRETYNNTDEYYQEMGEGSYTITPEIFEQNMKQAFMAQGEKIDQQSFYDPQTPPVILEIPCLYDEQDPAPFNTLELSINYPISTLTARPDDKGYRFKLTDLSYSDKVVTGNLTANELDPSKITSDNLSLDSSEQKHSFVIPLLTPKET